MMPTDDRHSFSQGPDPVNGQSLPRGSVRSQHGRVWGFLMHKVINPVMRRLLTGRFHGRMGSDTLMVLTFRGRRSGQTYTFPIGYMQDGSTLISYTPFSWWRNLSGGAPVSVVLRGRAVTGSADVCTNTDEIAAGLAVYLRHNPGDAKYFYVSLDHNQEPELDDVTRAAQNTAQVTIDLD